MSWSARERDVLCSSASLCAVSLASLSTWATRENRLSACSLASLNGRGRLGVKLSGVATWVVVGTQLEGRNAVFEGHRSEEKTADESCPQVQSHQYRSRGRSEVVLRKH